MPFFSSLKNRNCFSPSYLCKFSRFLRNNHKMAMFMCFEKKKACIAETPTHLWKHRNQHVKREIKLPNFPFFVIWKVPTHSAVVCWGPSEELHYSEFPKCHLLLYHERLMLQFHIKQGGAWQSVTWPDTVDSLAEPPVCYWTWRQKEIREEGNSTCNLILLARCRAHKHVTLSTESSLLLFFFSSNLCCVMM